MKSITAAFAALLMLVATTFAAHAGLVLEEEEVVNQGTGPSSPVGRTVMIQGNKQKMITDHGTVVTDLDKGVLIRMDPSNKSYIEIPFPPTGQAAAMMTAAGMSSLSFKKTGAKKKVAGYACEEYSGAGQMMGNQYSITGCFSTTAPGAHEFSAFQKAVAKKVKGTALEMGGPTPDGVPLVINSKTRITHFSMPGMAPEQADKINKMLANRPAVLATTTVTKITQKRLSASEFVVPAGYTQASMSQGLGGPAGAGPAASKPAPEKVPE
jgi:Domain of unknown function (DUF4412)